MLTSESTYCGDEMDKCAVDTQTSSELLRGGHSPGQLVQLSTVFRNYVIFFEAVMAAIK